MIHVTKKRYVYYVLLLSNSLCTFTLRMILSVPNVSYVTKNLKDDTLLTERIILSVKVQRDLIKVTHNTRNVFW